MAKDSRGEYLILYEENRADSILVIDKVKSS